MMTHNLLEAVAVLPISVACAGLARAEASEPRLTLDQAYRAAMRSNSRLRELRRHARRLSKPRRGQP